MENHTDSATLKISEQMTKRCRLLMKLGLLMILSYIEVFWLFSYAKRHFDQVWILGLAFAFTIVFINAAFALIASANQMKKRGKKDFWLWLGISCGIFFIGYVTKQDPITKESAPHERVFKHVGSQKPLVIG